MYKIVAMLNLPEELLLKIYNNINNLQGKLAFAQISKAHKIIFDNDPIIIKFKRLIKKLRIENPFFEANKTKIVLELLKEINMLESKLAADTGQEEGPGLEVVSETKIQGMFLIKKLKELLKLFLNSIISLNLRNSNIGDSGVKKLAEALRGNNTLQKLGLRSIGIGVEGAEALAKMLKKNTTLKELNLYDNGIGDVGVEALAEVLENNPALEVLNLGWNYIRGEGAGALTEMLKTNAVLKELNISRNNIGDGGAMALAGMLETNKTLKALYLGRNNIGDVGAQKLAVALRGNTALTSLSLWGNRIGNDMEAELRQIVENINKKRSEDNQLKVKF